MKISRKSFLYRWAFFLSEEEPGYSTTVCELFWRTVFWTPVKLLLILAALTILSLAVYLLKWWVLLVPVFFVVPALIAITASRLSQAIEDRYDLKEIYRGFKNRYCPRVEVKD